MIRVLLTFLCSIVLFKLSAEVINLSGAPWKFTLGPEFPGAAGSMTRSGSGDKTTLIIDSDFSKGGNYTGISLKFDPALDIERLSFRIVSPAREVAVQVRDSSDQVFVRFLPISGSPDVSEFIEIDKFRVVGERAAAYWGGAKDGIVRPPFKALTIRTQASRLTDKSQPAIVRISEIKAKLRSDNVPARSATTGLMTVKGEPGASVNAPNQLVTAPGSAPVVFTLKSLTNQKEFSYQLRSCTGAELEKGRLTVINGKCIELPVPGENGFYEYVVPELNLTAGMLVLPRYIGIPDDFFGIDSAMSVFRVYKDAANADALLAILQWGGIACIRDRLKWRDIEKNGSGKFNYNAFNSERLRRQAAQHGLKVLDVFHDAPLWTGADSNRNSNTLNPFPRDLIRSADSWRQIGTRWGQIWCGLEVWNEPEIAFGASLPGDQLMALHKTISYEFATNAIDIPIVGGVFTGSSCNDKKLHLYLRNGLLENSDAFSFHSYDTAEQLQKIISDYRQALGGDPKSALPLWITECGKPWPHRDYRAAVQDDQEAGLHIAMKAVEAKANGVTKFFPFVFSFYRENINNFGMIDRNQTPMRSLAGYLNVVRTLANFRYAGDLKLSTGAKLNRVFVSGDEARIVIYTGNRKTPIVLPRELKIHRIEGLDGREFALQSQYTDHDGIIYCYASRTDIVPYLNSNTVAMKLLRQAESYRKVPRTAKPVVMQYDFNHADTGWTLYGYLFNQPENAKIPLIFNNLSDRPVVITPRLKLPLGAKTLTDLPEKLTLPSRNCIRTEIRINLSDAFKHDALPKIIIFDESKNAGPLVIGAQNWSTETLKVKAGLPEEFPTRFGKQSNQWIELNENNWKKWGGGHMPNIKAAFRISYNDDTMQLQILVDDRNFYQPYAIRDAWRADSVQIGIQTLDTDRQRKQPFTEIIAAHTAKGDLLFRSSCESGNKKHIGELTRSTLDFRANPHGMLYTIRLNAGELGIDGFKPGMRFGFAMLINSSEGKQQRDGYLHWGDGIGENKNAREFNILKLQ